MQSGTWTLGHGPLREVHVPSQGGSCILSALSAMGSGVDYFISLWLIFLIYEMSIKIIVTPPQE